MLRILAPAKINWFLEILGRRADGFHEIETVMQAVSLFDEISVNPAPELTLQCDVGLGPVEQNLAYRAAALLRDEHAPGKGAAIALRKNIPHGAGLGGGSSDAACTLVALNRLWELGLGADRLRELAGRIGSDCAFFVEGGMAHCTGRGEVVRALPDLPMAHVVILYPGVVSPTGAVYADAGNHLTHGRRDCYLAHARAGGTDLNALAASIHNRLQDSAIRVCAGLGEAWVGTANEQGALARFVSGSGSSIAFLMQDATSATGLATSLQARLACRAFAVTTLPRGATLG